MKNAYPRTAPATFTEVLGSYAALMYLVVIRVSSRSLADIMSQSELGRRAHGHVPELAAIADLPSGVLQDDAEGAALRAACGAATIYRRDASPHAAEPSAVMGYAIPTGAHALTLFIHDTAAQPNVNVPGDPIPRVAFSELLVGLMAHNKDLRSVHFNEFKRMTRNELEQQRLYEAARRFDVALHLADRELDVVSVGGRTLASVEGAQASAEVIATRTRTTGGVLNALNSGRDEAPPAWPHALSLLALGYGPVLDASGRIVTRAGSKTSRWKLIAPDPAEVDAVREMLRLVADGRDWADCAQPLVNAKVLERGQRSAGKRPGQAPRTWADKPKESRAAAVQAAVSNPGHRHLWATGRYIRTKDVPVAVEGTTFEGYPINPVHGRWGEIDIDVNFGLPPGGFMDDDTLRRIEARLSSRTRKDGTQRTTCALFAYLPAYRDGDDAPFEWERRLTRVGDLYYVHERPGASALDDRGRLRGWQAWEGDPVITVRRSDLESSVALAIARAVHAVADQRLAVQIRDAGPSDEVVRLRERHAKLEADATEAFGAGTAADRMAATAARTDHFGEAAIARHSSAASRHFAEAQRLEAEIDRVREAIEQAQNEQPSERQVDLGSPAAVAGCLQAYVGHDVPLEVNQALRRVGLDTLRLEHDPSNSRRVLWSMHLELPLADGGTAAIPVRGVVRNRRRDQEQAKTRLEVDAAVAEHFLKDGADLETVATAHGMDRKAAVVALRNHLSRHGIVKRGLRSAIVDLPTEMAETRLALWSIVSGDTDAASHLPHLRRHLERVYTSGLDHPNLWVRRDCTLARKALNAMVAALPHSGSTGVTIEDLARVIGASRTDINRLCNDRADSGSINGKKRGILVRDKANPGVVRMRTCPHPDCPAAHGYRWLSHYMPVPETDGYNGLICPSCYRLPDTDLADLYLPSAYVDILWNGPASAAHHDLGTAPATTATPRSQYRPSTRMNGRRSLFSLSEAAELLGVTDRAVRTWIADTDDPLPAKRINGPGGMKHVLTEEALSEARQHPRLEQLRRTSPRPQPIDGEYVTLAELADANGVSEHYLRKRAVAGLMGSTERRNLRRNGQAHLVVSRTVLNADNPKAGTDALPAEWIERHQTNLLLMKEAAEVSGFQPWAIRKAVVDKELRSYITDGGTHRFRRADLLAWAESRGTARLNAKSAAKRAGVGYEAIRRATLNGDLDCQRTPGGHARYDEAEVDRWAAARG